MFAAAYAGEVGELAVCEGEDAGAVVEEGGGWADVVFHFFLFGRVLVGVVLRWNAGWTLGFGLRLVWATPDFLFLASVILCFVLPMSHCESLVAMVFNAQHQH